MFRFANDEHGARRGTHDLFSCAAEKHAAEALSTVGRHNDQVGIKVASCARDFNWRRALSHKRSTYRGIAEALLERFQFEKAFLGGFKIKGRQLRNGRVRFDNMK